MSHLNIPTKTISLPSDQSASGRTLGDEEILLLTQAIRSGVLTCTKGEFGKELERSFAEQLGVPHAHACSSGTAAIHCAIAALDLSPGDEIITTPITDMGAIAPILYQGAIPVFADVDPRTCNVTAATIEAKLSPRTRAIIVTHLFGNPCEMEPILTLSASCGIPLIEDAAQAFGARYHDRLVGTLGAIGCFSLQQGKHITTGEGGICVTRDPALARKIYLFINKGWGYGDERPDHYFLALNYRMSELQGAVALGQLPKLPAVVRQRIDTARRLTARLDGLEGVAPPWTPAGATHSYWKYCLRIDGSVIPGGAVAMGRLLQSRGIASAPRYIQKPAFACEVIAKQRTFGSSRWPFTLARPEAVDYGKDRYPGTFKALEDVLVLPWNEKYTNEHVTYIADALRWAAETLRKGER